MKIRFEEDYLFDLEKQIRFIAKDKPQAAKKFKSDLLQKLNKDLKLKNQFIIMMNPLEIMFSKDMSQYIKLRMIL